MSHAKAKKHLWKDEKLKNMKVPRIPVFKRSSYFNVLVTAIIYQQISGIAASAIYERILSRCGGRITPEKIAAMSESDMKSLGLSSQKIRYLNDLASKFINKEINVRKFSRQSDEEIIKELTRIKGIGLWTAQMFLIFSLGREDVFPVKDLGIRKAFAKLHGMDEIPAEEEMLKLSEKWRPYRTYASLILWSIVDTQTPKGVW